MLFPVNTLSPIAGARGTTPSSLLQNLVAYWKLDEASGSRADSVGSNTLSDNNTVTQATGKVGNAAQFTAANNEYLRVADNANLSMNGTAFTLAFWAYHDTLTGIQGYVSKDDGAGQREYFVFSNAGSIQFVVFDNIASPFTVVSSAVPVISTWYFIVAWFTGTVLNISVNNGAADTLAYTGAVKDGTAAFELGRQAEINGRCFNGRMDEVGVWRRALSASERTTLYSSGSGKTHPF